VAWLGKPSLERRDFERLNLQHAADPDREESEQQEGQPHRLTRRGEKVCRPGIGDEHRPEGVAQDEQRHDPRDHADASDSTVTHRCPPCQAEASA
jgi:hypothetical protein